MAGGLRLLSKFGDEVHCQYRHGFLIPEQASLRQYIFRVNIGWRRKKLKFFNIIFYEIKSFKMQTPLASVPKGVG